MKKTTLVVMCALTVIALFSLITFRASAAPETTFVVNSTSDQADDNPGNGICHTAAGKCSLRAAIDESNAHSGKDTIAFHIGNGGIRTIQPLTDLPTISDPVNLNGTTEPNCSKYPCIVLDGSMIPATDYGLNIDAGNSLVKGLVVENFTYHGYGQAIELSGGGGNTIVGNYLGTDVTGTLRAANDYGLFIISNHNTIGGTGKGERNLISGNLVDGIDIYQANGNVLKNNFIGTDVTGTQNLSNAGDGINITHDASNNIIGGTGKGERNIIAYNELNGVALGINGQEVKETLNNSIRGNEIVANGLLGIDLGADGVTLNDTLDADGGPNRRQNFPVVTSAVSTSGMITGNLHSKVNGTYTIDLYSNPQCDGSGFGEGKTWLGSVTVTTNSNGVASFNVHASKNFTAGSQIKGTATDATGSTSEFGQCKTAS